MNAEERGWESLAGAIPTGHSMHARTSKRDEGTSYHYLPAAESVDADAVLAAALQKELGGLGLPVVTGPVWTTDAPYRETAVQLERHAKNGILAVEMQAASLYAFGAARGVRCGVVAHVTIGVEHSAEAQVEKGPHQLGLAILKAMSRAGRRCLVDCRSQSDIRNASNAERSPTDASR
jgi:uridine phosphorylase